MCNYPLDLLWINLVKKNKHQYYVNIMHNEKVNKTRYDDPGKPMKQTSFTVKNLGGNLPEKQSIIIKRSFRSSTKPLSLYSTISVDEFIAETFYRFRTSELFNIWTPHFLHGSLYMTNQRCTAPSTWLTHQLKEDVGYKFFHFINDEDQKALDYKTLRHKDAVASFRENKALGHLLLVFSLYSLMWRPLK